MQVARHRCRTLPRRASETETIDGVVGNEVHDRVLAGEQRGDAVQFFVAVVDRRRAGSTGTGSDSRSRARSARRVRPVRPGRCAAHAAAGWRASPARVECSDRASAGLTGPRGSRSNTRRSPTVEKTRFLWPIPPTVPSSSMASSTLSRLWAGSPMPMNTTLLTTRRARASTTCATISALPSWRSRPSRPGHAEDAADRAADLGRDAQAIARQQHALHRLAIGQFDQQARRTVFARVLRAQARERVEFRRDGGQCGAQLHGKEMLGPAFAAVERQCLHPSPKHEFFVARFGAMGTQALPDVFDAHRRRNVASAGRKRAPADAPYTCRRTVPRAFLPSIDRGDEILDRDGRQLLDLLQILARQGVADEVDLLPVGERGFAAGLGHVG